MLFEPNIKVSQLFLYLFVIFALNYILFYDIRGDEVADNIAMIAVLDNHGYQQSIDQWTPTANYLTQEIPDWSFSILPLNPEEYESAIADRSVDFSISCPSLYVKLEVLYHVTRIVTMKTHYGNGIYDFFACVLLCRSDRNDIIVLDDLRGKSLMGTHGPNCTAWHIACSEMMRHNLDPARDFKEVIFSTNANDIIQSILDNKVDVGIIRSDIFDKWKITNEMNLNKIHVIHEEDVSHRDVPFDHSTSVFPERVFAKLPQTPDELTEQVTVALLRMSSTDYAAKAARCSGWTIPHNYQPIHEILKTLQISPYEQFGKITIKAILKQYGLWIISIFVLAVAIIVSLSFTLVQTKRLHQAKRMILEQQIIESSDRQQENLGRIIHDTLGQQLTAIRLLTDTLRKQADGQRLLLKEPIRKIQEIARNASQQSRHIATNLYPIVLSQQGFENAVGSYLEAMKATFGIAYELNIPGKMPCFDPKLSLNLYRIIQEAVHNTIKHGQAKQVLILLKKNTESYILIIEDDGIGFDQDEIRHIGLGLHIMEYRANSIQGKLKITRTQAGGTRVICTFIPTKHAFCDKGRKPRSAFIDRSRYGTDYDS